MENWSLNHCKNLKQRNCLSPEMTGRIIKHLTEKLQ